MSLMSLVWLFFFFFLGLHQISLSLSLRVCRLFLSFSLRFVRLRIWAHELWVRQWRVWYPRLCVAVLYITDVTDNNNNTDSISSFLLEAKFVDYFLIRHYKAPFFPSLSLLFRRSPPLGDWGQGRERHFKACKWYVWYYFHDESGLISGWRQW